MTSVYLIVAAIALLETKHLIADFVLQSAWQVKTKGIYGHPGGLLHSGIHAVLSIPVFLLLPTTWTVGIGLVVAEFVLHYHIDWGKDQVGKLLKLQPTYNRYWWLFGFDQWLHHMTYLGYVMVLAAP